MRQCRPKLAPQVVILDCIVMDITIYWVHSWGTSLLGISTICESLTHQPWLYSYDSAESLEKNYSNSQGKDISIPCRGQMTRPNTPMHRRKQQQISLAGRNTVPANDSGCFGPL